MLRKKVKTWFLLTYLVLLVNFAPSLHHAPIFGLHGLHNAHAHADSGQHSCCCHSHQNQSCSHEADSPESDPLGRFANDDLDCAFCKFFDEYNVVITTIAWTDVESPISLFDSELSDKAAADVVPMIARGPPAFWFQDQSPA